MKTHTNLFKNNIKEMGKEINSIITYGTTTLEDELYSISLHYEGNLLKSIMKQLDIESSVDIPLETIINFQFGLKVDGSYEYLDYGNFVVYKSEKQEDTNTYKITCYDKMLYSMKDYEDMQLTYPITIKNYLNAIATQIGLTLKDTSFSNQNLSIPAELYLGQNYTYRDVLDEIAQATASNIIINNNDELEVKYFNDTNDTITEEYLKDINVKFGEKYGVINSIVLSRSAESDNVYIQDQQSIEENGLTEIKIVDNQIMNGNNRSDYLQGLFNRLNGLEFYINDFSSTGICYYEPCDTYNIQIGNNTYKCVMLNDEINITSGLEELIHTDIPNESETDYTKADKTDRRINQTYLIVDKQNQIIESVVNNVTEQNNKIARISQTVDELNTQISNIANITISGETTNADLLLSGINTSEPINIKIHANNSNENISYLYPRENLYPSDTLYLKSRTLRFIRTYIEEGVSKTENIDYELPADLLYYSGTVYDEFYLDYESETCQVTKRCGYNADGTVYQLAQEQVLTFDYPEIILEDGDYEIVLLGYDYAYLKVTLMASNIYTTQFATKVEMNSKISQTAEEINLEVSKKVGNDEIISKINQSAEQVKINANKISLERYYNRYVK